MSTPDCHVRRSDSLFQPPKCPMVKQKANPWCRQRENFMAQPSTCVCVCFVFCVCVGFFAFGAILGQCLQILSDQPGNGWADCFSRGEKIGEIFSVLCFHQRTFITHPYCVGTCFGYFRIESSHSSPKVKNPNEGQARWPSELRGFCWEWRRTEKSPASNSLFLKSSNQDRPSS